MSKANYIALRDGWIAGRFVRKDTPIQLSETEARHENVAPKPKSAPKPRRSRRSSK